jgi:hypothetical protein
MMKVEAVKLSDGAVSVLLDGHEVHILPRKSECELSDLEEALKKVVAEIEGEW